MTKYVMDTNSFRILQDYYPRTFRTFWEQFDDLVHSGELISVSDVYKELDFQLTALHMIEWIDQHKDIFTAPTAEETQAVKEIFEVQHFQQLVGDLQRETGAPVADPWLVARAMVSDACVITEEKEKPNAAKIPNVCTHFGCDCADLEEMLGREGWSF